MHDVLIEGVELYRDRNGIARFVEAVFGVDETLDAFLSSSRDPQMVVVKPNWVQKADEYQPDVWEPVITHPALVMAVLEALAERMEGRGRICLCDAPQSYANFNAIPERGGLLQDIHVFRKR